MKIKSFAMLAASSLLAATCLYVAPAMADDTSPNAGQAMPAPADNSSQNTSMNNLQSNSSSMQNDISTSSNPDEGSPDTATGDDDY